MQAQAAAVGSGALFQHGDRVRVKPHTKPQAGSGAVKRSSVLTLLALLIQKYASELNLACSLSTVTISVTISTFRILTQKALLGGRCQRIRLASSLRPYTRVA